MTLDVEHVPFIPRSIKGLYQRLIDKSADPESEQGCWAWLGRCKTHYPRLNMRGPDGLTHREIRPHRAMLVLLECGAELEHFWDLYDLYSWADFDADHTCYGDSRCINPDHLQWLEKSAHGRKTRLYVHPDKLYDAAARLARW